MKRLTALMLFTAMALAAAPGFAAEKAKPAKAEDNPAAALPPAPKLDMHVSNPYAFATAPGAKNGAVFLTISYTPGMGAGPDIAPDRLIKVQTPVADMAMLHTNMIEGDTMNMRAVDSFPLPPTGTFSLTPQGAHIMLMDLHHDLKTGDKFPVTLVFQNAGPVTVDVPVRAPGDVPADPNAPSAPPPSTVQPAKPATPPAAISPIATPITKPGGGAQ